LVLGSFKFSIFDVRSAYYSNFSPSSHIQSIFMLYCEIWKDEAAEDVFKSYNSTIEWIRPGIETF
jgi:hypothetical protein